MTDLITRDLVRCPRAGEERIRRLRILIRGLQKLQRESDDYYNRWYASVITAKEPKDERV